MINTHRSIALRNAGPAYFIGADDILVGGSSRAVAVAGQWQAQDLAHTIKRHFIPVEALSVLKQYTSACEKHNAINDRDSKGDQVHSLVSMGRVRIIAILIITILIMN